MPSDVFRWRLTFTDGRQEIVEADSVRRTEVLGEIGLWFWETKQGRSELQEVARLPGVALVQRLPRTDASSPLDTR